MMVYVIGNGFVNWVADNDSEKNVKFAAQQQHMDMLKRIGAPTDLYSHPCRGRRVLSLLVCGTSYNGAHGPTISFIVCSVCDS